MAMDDATKQKVLTLETNLAKVKKLKDGLESDVKAEKDQLRKEDLEAQCFLVGEQVSSLEATIKRLKDDAEKPAAPVKRKVRSMFGRGA